MTATCRPAARARCAALLCAMSGLVLGGCDDGGTHARAPELALPVPSALLQTRAIELDALRVELRLGTGAETETVIAERSGDDWTATLTIPPGVETTVTVTWFERLADGREIPLARWSSPIGPLDAAASIAVDPGGYETEPFDFDSDGVANLVERENGSGPTDPNDPAPREERSVDVRVPRVDGDGPPFSGRAGEWWTLNAVGTGTDGQDLLIDNLVTGDEDAEAPDGGVSYRWLAAHDGERLYLFVEFEPPHETAAERDSDEIFNDDALNLYVDGDRGRAVEIDVAGDDRHVIIPKAAREEIEANALPPAVAGSGTVALPAGVPFYRYESGWELRFPLADLGIPIGVPFGFEVQIDQDVGIGDRDALWAWASPSAGNGPAEFVNGSPAFYGTVLLEP